MKLIAKSFALAWLSVITAAAGPVQRNEIDADAKWLLHMDVQQFRSTKVGRYVIDEVLKQHIREPLNKLKQEFKFEVDPDKILEQFGSITAYGTSYQSPKEDAVLMIKTDPDVQAAFVGVLAGLSLAGTNSPVQLELTQIGKVAVYSAKDKVYCAVLPGKLVALSASRKAIEKAAKVLDGKARSLDSSRVFADFAMDRHAFFFLGMAEGFSADTALPPQAKLLQMADGGFVALGEDADQLFLNLALKAKTSEVVTQMQQVLQGLIAMASLDTPDDKDLTQLIQSTKVSATDKVVSVSVEFPADRLIQKINDKVSSERQRQQSREAADQGDQPPVQSAPKKQD